MKVKEIITDDLMDLLAVRYCEKATDKTADWSAIKLIAEIVAVSTANALGINLEVEPEE